VGDAGDHPKRRHSINEGLGNETAFFIFPQGCPPPRRFGIITRGDRPDLARELLA